MLLDTVATVILAGMMLIPLVNIFVGIIVGAWFAGLPGGLLGLALAIAVTAAEKLVGERRGWFDVVCENDTAVAMQRSSGARRSERRMTRRRAFPAPTRRPLPTVRTPDNYAPSLH
jgi:hypothetical protein